MDPFTPHSTGLITISPTKPAGYEYEVEVGNWCTSTRTYSYSDAQVGNCTPAENIRKIIITLRE